MADEKIRSNNPWRKAQVGDNWVTGRTGRVAILAENERVATWLTKALNERLCLQHANALLERALADRTGESIASIRNRIRARMKEENAQAEPIEADI